MAAPTKDLMLPLLEIKAGNMLNVYKSLEDIIWGQLSLAHFDFQLSS